MKRIFLLNKFGDGILATETTNIGRKAESRTPQQFKSWAEAEAHFLALGAPQETLDACRQAIEKTGNAMLTIDSL
jgi:hypothetical protein